MTLGIAAWLAAVVVAHYVLALCALFFWEWSDQVGSDTRSRVEALREVRSRSLH